MEKELEVFYGKVEFFSNKKGYGFIKWEKNGIPQQDMFCHFSDLGMQGYKSLQKEQSVSFSIGKNKDGKPKAINVKIITN